jgi:Lrp/AsnC family transcriptional regulator for asnA, asnC and gidA
LAHKHKLDDTDLAIIRILQEDGRKPFAEIAAELKLAASTVQQRATRLIESGAVKIRAVTEGDAVGIHVIATIAVNADGTRLREVANEISKFSEVSYVVICTGPYDLLIEVGCKDNDHLLSFISDKLAKVKGVRESDTFVYLRIVKNTYQWGIPE